MSMKTDFGKVDKIEVPEDAQNAPEVTLDELLSLAETGTATEEEYYLDDEETSADGEM